MKKDFKEFLYKNLKDWIEEHLETWKDHYYRKKPETIEYELSVNYDFSADIESVELALWRELSDDEKEHFRNAFIQAVIDNFYLE